MKIKRYLDSDMRKVLRRVREDQGPDAVILSNRRTPEGIEVIAAIDYDESILHQALGSQPGPDDYRRMAEPAGDQTGSAVGSEAEAPPVPTLQARVRPEPPPAAVPKTPPAAIPEVNESIDSVAASADAERDPVTVMRTELSSVLGMVESRLSEMAWQHEAERSPMRAQMLRNLARIGIAPDVANTVVNRLRQHPETRQVWRAPLAELVEMLPVAEDDLVDKGGVIALVGPTGVGKTTTIAKIAARYAIANGTGDIALVCADAYRIGAKEHLSAFGQIIGVPVHSLSESTDLSDLLHLLRRKKLVLIDTDGVSQRSSDLGERLRNYQSELDEVRFYLTLSAASQDSVLDETIRRFGEVPLAGAVISKIDEAGQLGGVVSALIRHGLPAVWFSDGQRIPDDLHAASSMRLWLISQAIKCMEASDPQIDDSIMAARQAQALAQEQAQAQAQAQARVAYA